MDKEEFYQYILDNFSLSGEAQRLVDNILSFVEKNYQDAYEQQEVLIDLLGGIALSEEEIRKVSM